MWIIKITTLIQNKQKSMEYEQNALTTDTKARAYNQSGKTTHEKKLLNMKQLKKTWHQKVNFLVNFVIVNKKQFHWAALVHSWLMCKQIHEYSLHPSLMKQNACEQSPFSKYFSFRINYCRLDGWIYAESTPSPWRPTTTAEQWANNRR